MQTSLRPDVVSEVTSQAASSPSHSERALALFCSITLLLGTVLYYTVFQYRLYFAGLIIVVVAHVLVRGGRFAGLGTLASLFAFEAYQALSSFWSPDWWEGVSQSGLDVVFMSFALIPLFYPDLRRQRLSLALLRWYAVAMLCCIGFNELVLSELIDLDKGAFRSVFGATLLVGLAPLAGEAILNRSKLSLAVLLVVVAVGLQLESRLFTLFSIPVLLVAGAICYLTGSKNLRIIYPVAFLLAALAILVGFQAAGLSGILEGSRLGADNTLLAFGDTVFSEANTPGADSVDVERRLATQVAIDSFRQAPIFGTGYMSTSYYVGLLTRYETVAHGLPFGLLAETGLIGTILFVIACVLALRGYLLRLRLCPPEEKRWIYIELLTFVTALVAGLFHQANHDFYLYLLIGGGLAGRRLRSAGTTRPTMA